MSCRLRRFPTFLDCAGRHASTSPGAFGKSLPELGFDYAIREVLTDPRALQSVAWRPSKRLGNFGGSAGESEQHRKLPKRAAHTGDAPGPRDG
jgi:hypothetical protein